jgi:hypothetical protein
MNFKHWFNFLRVLCLSFLLGLVLMACWGKEEQKVLSVSIETKPAEMMVGQVIRLEARVEARGTASRTLTWSSSDSSVATVSGDGILAGIQAGAVTISARSNFDASFSDSFLVIVKAESTEADVTSVTINSKPASLDVGVSHQLSASVHGNNNPSQAVTWSSSNQAVAQISDTGLLTTLAAGQTTVTAQSAVDPSKADSFTLSVGEDSSRKVDYDGYSATLPTWESFSPQLPDAEVKLGETESRNRVFEGADYRCDTTPYSITKTPEKIVTLNPDIDAFWVGSLLQGKGYAQGLGSLRELPIRQRAPVTLYIDLLGPGINRTVENPDASSVQQAIAELIIELQRSNIPFSGDISYLETTKHTTEQSSLNVGVSGKFLSARVSASLASSRHFSETTVTAHFYQKLFTVTMVTPQTPADFFSNEFTQEALDAQIRLGRIGPDNIPVFVSSITYGRILHFNMTARASASAIKSALNASYRGLKSGGSIDLTEEQRRILRESTVQVVALGGDQENALSIIRTGDLRAYFDRAAPLTTATPISYQVKNLGDNSNALISETTTYNIEECQITRHAIRPRNITQQTQKCTTAGTGWDVWRGTQRRSCDTPAVRIRLNSGDYFDPNTLRLRIVEGSGSPVCRHEFSDYFVNENRQRVPRTISVHGHTVSPGCTGCRGWVKCELRITAYERPRPN